MSSMLWMKSEEDQFDFVYIYKSKETVTHQLRQLKIFLGLYSGHFVQCLHKSTNRCTMLSHPVQLTIGEMWWPKQLLNPKIDDAKTKIFTLWLNSLLLYALKVSSIRISPKILRTTSQNRSRKRILEINNK